MTQIASPTKVKWNEIAEVGMPTKAMAGLEEGAIPRTFLCRGEWSIFTSTMFDDGSGFTDAETDAAVAWAVIEGF